MRYNIIYRYLVWIAILSNFSCNTSDAPDCIQASGQLVRITVPLSNFDKITVFEKIALVVKQGPEQKVEIETGEYLLNEINAVVTDGRLILKNGNSCNWVRDYGITTIYVTAPNIVEIRSSTGQQISSDGILSYPRLNLLCESYNDPETQTTDGSFILKLNTDDLTIVVNGIAYFNLEGFVKNLGLTIAAGDSRIEAKSLEAQAVRITHRGSNDMLINPQQSLVGTISGTGDVVSFHRPPTVDVKEIFNGRLLFRE